MAKELIARILKIRPAIVAKVKRYLQSQPANHPARRGHRLLRRLPLVSFFWRKVLAAQSTNFYTIESYRKAGGIYAPHAVPNLGASRQQARHKIPLEWRFIEDVVEAARIYERSYTPEPGSIVLVNCSAAAGGAERQLVKTLIGLKQRNYKPFFIGEFIEDRGTPLDFYLPHLRDAGIAFQRAKDGPLPSKELYADVTEPVANFLSQFEPEQVTRILGMVSQLREIKPEVIYLWQDQTSVIHGISAMIARVPRIILSGRNLNPTHFDYFQPWLHPGYQALEQQENVVLSNNSSEGARSYEDWLGLPTGSIQVILNGVDIPTSEILPELDRLRPAYLPSGYGTLVCGAFRMSREKRPFLWLDVAKACLERRPECFFVVAGDGPMMADVQAYARSLGIAERVSFLGEIQTVHTLQRCADVLLLTSEQEGTPNVLLEAQAHGTPVVTSNAGGVAACVLEGETGYVISSDRPDDFAQAVEAALLLSQRQGQGDLIRSFVAKKFGVDRMIEETICLFSA